jgi:peptidoglycan/xylan/chitin deacetylase (PgdA/CDA1 family)
LGFDPVGLEPRTVKEIPLALINERVDRAYAKYGVSFDIESDDFRPMSWDEARDLMRRGFTIGAHGLRHAILTRESESEALRDIQQCIGDVSSELGTQCRTFAFPNGNYTARLALHALRCGVETVMTTEPLWTDKHFPPWRLPRIQLFGAQTQLKIYLKLVAAASRWLANPDGTGRLHRNIFRQDRLSIHGGP